MSHSKSRRKCAVTHRAVNFETTKASDGDEEEDTVVVEPTSPDEDGISTKSTGKRTSIMDSGFSPENCTACSEQINTANSHHCKRHPHLNVLLCRNCYKYCKSGEISRDSNGQDEQCFWCCEGGQLICCDLCPKAFCKKCIKRNLGRSELSDILNMDDDCKWKCYACSPAPLSTLVEKCASVFKKLKKIEKPDAAKASDVKSSPKPQRTVKNSAKISFDLNDLDIGNCLTTKNISPVIDKLVSDSNSFMSKIRQAQNACFKIESKYGRRNPSYAENIVSDTRENVNRYIQRVLHLVGFTKNLGETRGSVADTGVRNVDAATCNGSIRKLKHSDTSNDTVVIDSSDSGASNDGVSHRGKHSAKRDQCVKHQSQHKQKDDHANKSTKNSVKTSAKNSNTNDKSHGCDSEGFVGSHLSEQAIKSDDSTNCDNNRLLDSDEEKRQVRGKGLGKHSVQTESKVECNGAFGDVAVDVEVKKVSGDVDETDVLTGRKVAEDSGGNGRMDDNTVVDLDVDMEDGLDAAVNYAGQKVQKVSGDEDMKGNITACEREVADIAVVLGKNPSNEGVALIVDDPNDEGGCKLGFNGGLMDVDGDVDEDYSTAADENEDGKEKKFDVVAASGDDLDKTQSDENEEIDDNEQARLEMLECVARECLGEETGDESMNDSVMLEGDGDECNLEAEMSNKNVDSHEAKKQIEENSMSGDKMVKGYLKDGDEVTDEEADIPEAGDDAGSKEAKKESRENTARVGKRKKGHGKNKDEVSDLEAEISDVDDNAPSKETEKEAKENSCMRLDKKNKDLMKRKKDEACDQEADISDVNDDGDDDLETKKRPKENRTQVDKKKKEGSENMDETLDMEEEMSDSNEDKDSQKTKKKNKENLTVSKKNKRDSNKNKGEKGSESDVDIVSRSEVCTESDTKDDGNVETMEEPDVQEEKKAPESSESESDNSYSDGERTRKKRARSQKGKKESDSKETTKSENKGKRSADSKSNSSSTGTKSVKKKTSNKSSHCEEDVSSGHDSELEKDIKALVKPVKVKLVPLKMKEGEAKTPNTDKSKIKTKHKKEKQEELSLSTDDEEDGLEDGEGNAERDHDDVGSEEEGVGDAAMDVNGVEEEDEVSFKVPLPDVGNIDDDNVPSENDDEKEDDAKNMLLEEAKNMSPISDSSDSEPTPVKKKVVRNLSEKKKQDRKKKDEEVESETSDSEVDDKRKGKNVTKTIKNRKLLDAKITSSSSSSSSDEGNTKKREKQKKKGKELDGSEEDFQPAKKGKGRKRKKKEDSSGVDSWSGLGTTDDDEEDDPNRKKSKKKKKRKRIKDADSMDEGAEENNTEKEERDDDEEGSPDKGKRKTIRKVMSSKKLGEVSKAAAKAEVERRKRVDELQKKFNVVQEEGDDESSSTTCRITTQLVLESDKDGNPLIEVHKKLIRKLKPHQVEGIQFMWTSLIETVERCEKEEGSGCILAHCMGLGKSLSVVTLVHTLLTHKILKLKTCLIVAPLNTVLNWQNEWEKWLDEDDRLDVTELSSIKNNPDRLYNLQYWQKHGGIMIMGYQMFRMLSQGSRIRKKKMKEEFAKCLLDPGPDIVVCDEGHILKNDSSGISKAMCRMKTRRRVVLTGTPLQNNLIEYHCMVDFVKPNLLGTRTEFGNRFVNPITNGQCSDSTGYDVKLMKRRAHILHDLLSGCVQRRDYSALTKFLPPKHEYVIPVRLSKLQIDLYEKYLSSYGIGSENEGKGRIRGTRLFADYQVLSRIWTHPWVLKMDEIRKINSGYYDKSESEDSFVNDNSESESDASTHSSSSSDESSKEKKDQKDQTSDRGGKGRNTRNSRQAIDDDIEIIGEWKTKSRSKGDEVGESSKASEPESMSLTNGWWESYLTENDHYKFEHSGKLTLLMSILQMCGDIGDKVLVFTQSLLSLDLIEDFLGHVDDESNKEATEKTEEEKLLEYGKSWVHGADYFRMDGSTQVNVRAKWADMFNDEDNYRARLFLISTKAGSLGINLVGANRVIMFDASWNPSHDIQSIFRVYRFGQIKPVYIYRLLAQGTMEEKIYERQVTKQSLSQRVVDEHQIDRHFSSSDLQELYNFKPERLDDPARANKPTPVLPKDHLLAEILKKESDWIVSYHEHDSLLENKVDQELDEEERKAAWEDYENEKKGVRKAFASGTPGMIPGMGGMVNPYPQNFNPLMQQKTTLDQFDVMQMVHQIRMMNPHLSNEALHNIVKNFMRQQMTMQHQAQQKQQLEMNMMRQRQMQQQHQHQLKLQRQQDTFNRALFQPRK